MIERTNPATGVTAMEEATVLSTNGGIVLQFEDSIEIFSQGGLPERFIFTSIPENLRAKPTLSTLVNAGSDLSDFNMEISSNTICSPLTRGRRANYRIGGYFHVKIT